MTVKIPDTWPYARDLTLGEESTEYQNAMRCLLRGNEDGKPSARHAEWRFHNPRVTAQNDWITVEYRAFAWIERTGDLRIGPWKIVVDDQAWRVTLKPPDTLQSADWKGAKVRLGGLDASRIKPAPSSVNGGELVWAKPRTLNIHVDVDPPWQRYFTLTNVWLQLSTVGVVSWWVCASLVMALAALGGLPQRRPPAAEESGRISTFFRRLVGGSGRGFNEGPKQAVLHWAVLSAAVALTLILPMKAIKSPSWRTLIGIAAGLALVLVARPWCRTEPPSTPKPGAEKRIPSDGQQRRQARAVKWTASGVAALGTLVIAAPHLFGQGPASTPAAQRPGHLGLVLLGLATLWLGLAAMTAWAWRFAREGDLVPESWTEGWDSAPARWVAVVSALLAAIAAVILSCFWWAENLNWKRITWPSERTGTPDEVRGFLDNFPLQSLTWVYAYSWVLAGIALVALLRLGVARQRAEENRLQMISLVPDESNFPLTAAIFAFLVGLRQVLFAGSTALYGLWFLLIIFSLYAVRWVGQRWSVLGPTDEQFLSRTFGTPERVRELLKRAHEYRNCHHQIYLMEHGHANGAARDELEEELREQGRWLSGQGPEHPAEHYCVVDVALAWGPEPHWWDNARHAAKLAFFFGIPASIALVWLNSFPDYPRWLITLHRSTGLLEIVAKFCAWQIAWAGAGLVLGALWRVLPGRHSPVRALSLTVAYALPVGVGALLSRITDTELGYALLHVLLMLTVLTLTSLWMDTSTFKEERLFWPTRFSLLLSIYQVRGIAVQIAYVLAQVATAATIWHELASKPR